MTCVGFTWSLTHYLMLFCHHYCCYNKHSSFPRGTRPSSVASLATQVQWMHSPCDSDFNDNYNHILPLLPRMSLGMFRYRKWGITNWKEKKNSQLLWCPSWLQNSLNQLKTWFSKKHEVSFTYLKNIKEQIRPVTVKSEAAMTRGPWLLQSNKTSPSPLPTNLEASRRVYQGRNWATHLVWLAQWCHALYWNFLEVVLLWIQYWHKKGKNSL